MTVEAFNGHVLLALRVCARTGHLLASWLYRLVKAGDRRAPQVAAFGAVLIRTLVLTN
jgi:hypothetical protein